MSIEIRLLGIGGVEISLGGNYIFVDAFNDYMIPPSLGPHNILLFTHSDGDHFNAPHVLEAVRGSKPTIIGPPSIAYPLLAKTNLHPDCLKIVYPPQPQKPIELEMGDLTIKVYQTKHFNGWEPDHVSYLLKYEDRRIYISGDSRSFLTEDPDIIGVDALIFNTVHQDVLEQKISSPEGAELHRQELEYLQKKLQPKQIICNHLIGFQWTVTIDDLKKAVDGRVANVLIPESSDKVICI